MGIRRALKILLGIGAAVGLYVGYLAAIGNAHTVIAGKLYRSAQPSPERIALWRDRYGIKTIINLRGVRPNERWYHEEHAAARTEGIRVIDYPMSTKRDLSAAQVQDLLDLLAGAETPVLIHCKNGADRSGLVSALYVAGIHGGSEFYSELQMSPIYGHLPLWFLPAFAMDRTFENAEPRLGFPDS